MYVYVMSRFNRLIGIEVIRQFYNFSFSLQAHTQTVYRKTVSARNNTFIPGAMDWQMRISRTYG